MPELSVAFSSPVSLRRDILPLFLLLQNPIRLSFIYSFFQLLPFDVSMHIPVYITASMIPPCPNPRTVTGRTASMQGSSPVCIHRLPELPKVRPPPWLLRQVDPS